MTSRSVHTLGLVLLAVVMLAWYSGHAFLAGLFENNWSFSHWGYLPGWYGYLWLVLLAAAMLLVWRFAARLGSALTSGRVVVIGLIVLFVLFVLFRFDSIVYGGGNLRVAQISQVPRIMFRWFEFGAVGLAAAVYKVILPFAARADTAAGIAWRIISFGAAAASLVGAARIVSELTEDRARRFFWFVILLFGPQTILYLGFVGVEPLIVAVTIWFCLLAVRLERQFRPGRLAALWGIVLGGIIIHYTLAFLVPAAVYLTIATPGRQKARSHLAFLFSAVAYVALVVLLYRQAHNSLEFSAFILFPVAGPPHTDYGLFSPRRIGDIFQLFFLFAPLAIVMKLVAFASRVWMKPGPAGMAAWLTAVAGVTVVFVLNPVDSIVVDAPRLVAYLTPFSFLFVLVLSRLNNDSMRSLRLTSALAVACVWLPLAYAPAYTAIDRAAPYAEDYFDKHDAFHRIGGYAFRDAYFYNRDFTKADKWEVDLPIKSPDILNLRGCTELAAAGKVNDALPILHRIIARHPYWLEPREITAAVLLNDGQPDLAKPQIDTCLMLAPYRKNCHSNLYTYYRNTGRVREAFAAMERALRIFPNDKDILVDHMFLASRTGQVDLADSAASRLLAMDSTLAQPYLVKGNLAERRGEFRRATECYERFVVLAPGDPLAPLVMERLEELNQRLDEN
ncbi:MAG TPA: hypothetical protein VMY05_08060 [Acidobacteriota bacterium]|nr:hypothetical protein [Acidobacteriota bacterium]